MKILDYNELRNSTITASSANELFPTDNLFDKRRVKKFKFTGNVSENIVIFQSGLSFDSAILDSHNLTDSATVKFQANGSDSWTSPAIDITVTVADTISYFWSAVQSYDYFRVLIEDPTNTEPIEIGMIFLSTGKEIGIRDGFTLSDFNIGRVSYRTVDISTPYFENLTELNEFLERTAGTLQLSVSRQQLGTAWPFYAIIDCNNVSDYPPIYGVKPDGVQKVKVEAHNAFTFPLTIQEVN